MERSFVDSIIKKYLAEQFFASLSVLEEDNTAFTINSLSKSPYIKIMAFNKCVIVNTSKSIHSKVKSALSNKSRDEIFEFPFIYGQTIHYIPDVKKIQKVALLEEYTYELLQGNDIYKLRGIEGFDNSIAFDCNGNTSTKIVFLAKKDDEIVGLAGAGEETQKLWEIGVDVKSEHRKGGLGTKLVADLTLDIIKQGIVPFYSASITNIGSQMVANRSGYVPYWIDTYGNILDGSSPYNIYVKNLEL
ncbi:GCN5-related N-acetyltransferase [Clostridium sp. DL-VIII]|uniref:GNAT family N-acetyltransferase n=1 Tax=Clostridium sp. DL-VIII TaxID=641107 RepID=UPI00023AF953|nr:GNAT family N-acetyltransferase [Clostridium sp. DL-VIII]EHI99957.1 GCN5-related N-acetyltransferase [Clostridium sp. DL-VIII]